MNGSHVSQRRALLRALQGGLGAWLVLMAAACAEPRFPADAAVEDGEAGPGAAAAREDLVGRYASRAFLYAIDGLLRPTAEEISVVEIKQQGDKLLFEQKSCLYEGQVAFVLEGFLRYEFPADLPPLTAELKLERTKFSTEWMTYTLGYDEEAPPPECDSEDSAPARADQTWLSDACTCVSNPRPDQPPASDDDCRVTDPDGDGEPGATLELVVSGAQTWTYEVLQRVRLRYLNGYRAPNGNVYADLETGATTQVLECNEADLMSSCLLQDPVPCAPKYNQTELVPVDDDYDCARVVAEKNGLFPRPIPPFPAGCIAGT